MDSVNNAGGRDGSHGGGFGTGSGHSNGFNVGSGSGLKQNPGLATYWSEEEQAILEDGIVEYASDQSIIRYAKIAIKLPNKSIRDVALRYQWLMGITNANRMEVDIPKESNNGKGITNTNRMEVDMPKESNNGKPIDANGKKIAKLKRASGFDLPNRKVGLVPGLVVTIGDAIRSLNKTINSFGGMTYNFSFRAS